MEAKIISDAIEYIEKLFNENFGGHDFSHSLRVYKNALKIAEKEECDLEIVKLAALLHDVDDHKLFNNLHNENARHFLNEHNVPKEKVERICEAINSVSFSKNRGRKPETIEGMIVQDADRLDAIGAIGIARTFAFGGEHKRSLDSSIEHFHEKLLLLKDEMNTDTAKSIATKRHEFMEEFLNRYNEETK